MSLLKDVKPELYIPESIKRKKEMILELAFFSPKFFSHTKKCDKTENCEICKKTCSFINIFLEAELEMKGMKTNFKKLQEDGIIDKMIFSDGITF